MNRRVWIALVLVSAIIAVYFFNPFNTATKDPRARLLGVTTYRVASMAMAPTLITGDLLLTRTSVYTSQPPQRGDIVVFRYPKNRAYNFIFRVAAVPGDRIAIQNGIVHINSQPVDEPYLVKSELSTSRLHTVDEYSVPEGHVFVLGDNRDNAMDSRYWGPLPIEDIVGKAAYIWSSTKKERIGAIY